MFSKVKKLFKKKKLFAGIIIVALFLFFVFPYTKQVGTIHTKGIGMGGISTYRKVGTSEMPNFASSTAVSMIKTPYGYFLLGNFYDKKGWKNVSVNKGKEIVISGELSPLQTFIYFIRPFIGMEYGPSPPPLFTRYMYPTQFQILGTEKKTIEGFLKLDGDMLYLETYIVDVRGFQQVDRSYRLTGPDTEKLKWIVGKTDSLTLSFMGRSYFPQNSAESVFEYTSYRPVGGQQSEKFVNNLLLQYDQENPKQ